MQSWDGWPLERFVYLFIGAGFLLVWVQVSLLHWKGGFRSKFMWGPVIYTPVLVLTALLLVLSRNDTLRSIFVFAYALGVLEGLVGTFKHFHGVREMVGGFNLRNFLAGPPVVLPIIYAALAGFGLLVYYWPKISGVAA